MIRRALAWRGGALGDFVCTLPVLDRLREESEELVVVASPRWRALWDRADRWVDVDGLEALGMLGGGAEPLFGGGAEPLFGGGAEPLFGGGAEAELAVCWTAPVADALARAGVAEVLRGGLPLVGPPDPFGRSAAAQGSSGPSVAVAHATDTLWAPLVPRFGPRDRDPALHPPGPVSGDGPVVLAPGSGGARKRWPLDRWRELADLLPDPLWVGGPVEAGEPGWGAPRRDDLDLRGLVDLARRCRCWIGPDAGPTHLARAAGARVAAVFVGATDPRVWAPLGAHVVEGDPEPRELARWALGA